MDDPEEKTKQERVYRMEGIPISAYLSETGEFRWVPTAQACCDSQNTKRMLEVLKKMPEDRRTVWASRLDIEQTKMKCPVIRKETDLCKEFDEFCAAYDRTKKSADKRKGGERSNE